MSVLDDLLKGRGVQRVEDPGDGWGRDVYVRRLSTSALIEIQDQPETDAGSLRRMVIAVRDAACDSEGRPLFTDKDDVGRLPLDLIAPVAVAAINFGAGPEDAEGE